MTLAPVPSSLPPRRSLDSVPSVPPAVVEFLLLTEQDRQALAAARRVMVSYPCAHCGTFSTTASGALWRVSLADDCTDLYYLCCGCVKPYKRAHGLRSVEGRVPLTDEAPATPAGVWRTWSVADPAVGCITTLYDPDSRAVAYAVGADDPALARVAARLNGDAGATTGAVLR